MKFASVLMASLLLVGCASMKEHHVSDEATLKTEVPANYKAAVAEHIRSVLKDPYSVRDAGISKPFIVPDFVLGRVPVVCVRMNAKNSFGAYTGIKAQALGFRNGSVSNVTFTSSLCDRNIVYEPLHELEDRALNADARGR